MELTWGVAVRMPQEREGERRRNRARARARFGRRGNVRGSFPGKEIDATQGRSAFPGKEIDATQEDWLSRDRNRPGARSLGTGRERNGASRRGGGALGSSPRHKSRLCQAAARLTSRRRPPRAVGVGLDARNPALLRDFMVRAGRELRSERANATKVRPLTVSARGYVASRGAAASTGGRTGRRSSRWRRSRSQAPRSHLDS
jgi:hypothetical protein